MPRPFQNSGPRPAIKPLKALNDLLSGAVQGASPSLLDYGCGYGDWTRFLLTQNPSIRYSVFDPDKAAETYAEQIAPEAFDRSLNSFDIIVIFAVLELLPEAEQEQLLVNLIHKLKPGGRLLVQYNVYNPFSIRWILLRLAGAGNPRKYHSRKLFDRSYLGIGEVEAMFSRLNLCVRSKCTGPLYHKLPPRLDSAARYIVRSASFYSQIFYELSVKKY